ncbi:MAG: hypothetical protein SFU27_03705 [Thermonemataceae bacterium]|nr:hypothetical protein [Thermonemataceae bacterium]
MTKSRVFIIKRTFSLLIGQIYKILMENALLKIEPFSDNFV